MGFSLKKDLKGLFNRESMWGRGPEEITPEDLKKTQEQARELQRSGLSGLLNAEDPSRESVGSQIELEKKSIAQSAQDTLRKLRDLRTARGQIGTSLGMGTEAGIMGESALKQGQLQASLSDRLRQMQRESALTKIQGAAGSLNAPGTILMDQGKPGWVPGQMQAGGALIGGIFGGGQGAQAGGAAGKASGESWASTFSR